MDIKFFIGDIDEFYCEGVSGDSHRWAVWSQTPVPLDADDPARNRGAVCRINTVLLARFDNEQDAIQFVEDYDVGPGNNKIKACQGDEDYSDRGY